MPVPWYRLSQPATPSPRMAARSSCSELPRGRTSRCVQRRHRPHTRSCTPQATCHTRQGTLRALRTSVAFSGEQFPVRRGRRVIRVCVGRDVGRAIVLDCIELLVGCTGVPRAFPDDACAGGTSRSCWPGVAGRTRGSERPFLTLSREQIPICGGRLRVRVVCCRDPGRAVVVDRIVNNVRRRVSVVRESRTGPRLIPALARAPRAGHPSRQF